MERHHIVFKSQGGMDFDLNYEYLSPEDHRGNNSPHLNKRVDLAYKKEMQMELEYILEKDYYNIKELIDLLGLKEKQANRAFRKLLRAEGIKKDDIIKRLMGGRFYL